MKETYRIRLDTYREDGSVLPEILERKFTGLAHARREAEEQQARFDAECAPVAVLVVDSAGVPVSVTTGQEPEPEPDEPALAQELRRAMRR
ncbi:MAG: hypothetical protein ACREV7_16645 [Steroidobacteraceae bacterium]